MFKIESKSQFELGYEILATVIANEKGNAAMMEKVIPDLKRELRRYAHRDNMEDVGMGFKVERRIIKEYGIDGYIELVSIPGVFDSMKEADEFFMDFIYISIMPSAYDCTGQPFTSWYRLINRRGQFYAYHRVAMDV